MQPTNGEMISKGNGPSPRGPHPPCKLGDNISSPDRLSRCKITVDRGTASQAEELSSMAAAASKDSSDHINIAAEQVSEDIDRFAEALRSAAHQGKSDPPQVPDTVETFSRIIESRIASSWHNNNINSADQVHDHRHRHHKMTEEDSFFIESVVRLSKLTNALSEFSSSTSVTSDSLNRTSIVLQKAMCFLEEELRGLLEDDDSISRMNPNHQHSWVNSHRSDSTSETSKETSPDDPDNHHHEEEEIKNGCFPGYSPEMVTKMRRMVSAMISGGYERECFQVYSIARRNVFYEQLKKLEHEKLNMDDVWRMSWDSLEKEINRWIKIVKVCSQALFPAEKQLGHKVFSDHPLIFTTIFSNLARSVVIQLLDFAGAVAMTKRSAEKLFKFLDMHETLLDIIPAITDEDSEYCSTTSDDENPEHELKSEILATCDRLGEAATNIFLDLENSIKNDTAKTAVPGGAVHPLTRYVLNYLKYACEYKATLEKIFEKSQKSLDASKSDHHSNSTHETESGSPHGEMESRTPFSVQIVTLMDLLDANIEAKSMLYKDPSLRYIFLMNNGRYVLQKVKGSAEIHRVMGDTWCRRRSTVVRQFHKNYQRETWVRLLNCLNQHQEGLMANGKVNKTMLKERFKNFNAMFEEIHKSQSTWVVSDEQLQSELRVSISAVVIPAYRSFLGRFRQYLDSSKSKQTEKYIKYQPEDLESQIEGLFDGVPTSMARRKT